MLIRNLYSFLRRQLPICKGAFYQNGRKCMTTATKSDDGQLAAVDVSYASYETTSGQEGKSPIVILHGFLGSKSNWNSLSKAIHKNTERKVIALDARNHGDSPHTAEHTYKLMTADLVQMLNKLRIQKVNLVGHSMGGRTAMLMALLHPTLVSSLICVDISPIRTSPNIFSLNDILTAMAAVNIEPGVSLPQARKLASQQLVTIKDQDTKNFILTNLVQTNLKTYKWRVNLEVLRSSFTREVATFPKEFMNLQYKGPTRFIGGEMSDYIRKSDLEGIKNLFPLADLHYIPNAGHWLHSEKPSEFLEVAMDFWSKL